MPRHWETTRPFFLSAPRSAFAASRWCSLPAGCFPCRRLLRFPLSAVFHGAPANPHRCPQPVTASRCCRILFHAGSPAERQLFRTDFRFAPSPRSASLAGPPIHEDMVVHGLCGRVPDSAGKVYLPDCICPLDCCCSDRRKSVGPSAPIAYATSVSPPDEAVAWPGRSYWMLDEAGALPMSLHRE